MAWSKFKDRIVNYVQNNPGCSKWEVASLCTKSLKRCPSKQYYVVNTALKHGWIEGYFSSGRWHLYTPEAFILIEEHN